LDHFSCHQPDDLRMTVTRFVCRLCIHVLPADKRRIQSRHSNDFPGRSNWLISHHLNEKVGGSFVHDTFYEVMMFISSSISFRASQWAYGYLLKSVFKVKEQRYFCLRIISLAYCCTNRRMAAFINAAAMLLFYAHRNLRSTSVTIDQDQHSKRKGRRVCCKRLRIDFVKIPTYAPLRKGDIQELLDLDLQRFISSTRLSADGKIPKVRNQRWSYPLNQGISLARRNWAMTTDLLVVLVFWVASSRNWNQQGIDKNDLVTSETR